MKKAITVIAGLLTLTLSSCQFSESENPPIAGAAAVVGSRNVIGAEVNILGWRRVGIGIWLKQPTE